MNNKKILFLLLATILSIGYARIIRSGRSARQMKENKKEHTAMKLAIAKRRSITENDTSMLENETSSVEEFSYNEEKLKALAKEVAKEDSSDPDSNYFDEEEFFTFLQSLDDDDDDSLYSKEKNSPKKRFLGPILDELRRSFCSLKGRNLNLRKYLGSNQVYYVSSPDDLKTWYDAKSFCLRHGMFLAEISTDVDFDYLATTAREETEGLADGTIAYWTGGNNRVSKNSPRWDGFGGSVTQTLTENPDTTNNHCAAVLSDAAGADSLILYPCDERRPFFCEMPYFCNNFIDDAEEIETFI